ncbi:phosphatidylinositol 4-kinase beta-like [Arapaima gigas]
MGDTDVAFPPSQVEDLLLSPSSSSPSAVSCPSSPSSSSISSSCSDHQHLQGISGSDSGSSSSSSTRGSSPMLDVISEGFGELDMVIDPEVAQKACQEVLQKLQRQQGDSEPIGGITEHRLNNGTAPTEHVEGGSGKPPKIREEEEEDTGEDLHSMVRSVRQKNDSSKQSWLLRLFESKLFDISMAISYLYNSKEPGVQAYIGNRLFSFRHEDVDFYLPQLLNMYVHMDEEVGDAIKPYIVHRCRQGVGFSLQCAWLLGAYSSDMHISAQRHSRGTRLRKVILSDELKPCGSHSHREVHPHPDACLSPSKRTHQRSKSDAMLSVSLGSGLKRTASNPKVESSQDEDLSSSCESIDAKTVSSLPCSFTF